MSMTMIWTIILVLSIIIEAITIDLVSIWFGVGALVALVSQIFHASTTVQIVLFIVVSLICIVGSRPLAKRYLHGNTVKTNLDRMIGEHCLVTDTIQADKKGEVKVNDRVWFATSLNNEVITAGQYAQVVAIEGSHLIVKKI